MQCEVELDIFSGMPNPTWTLTRTESDVFMNDVNALSLTKGRPFSGSLGYRGMVVTCSVDGATRTYRVLAGIVRMQSDGATTYAHDKDRKVELWLRDTGRPYVDEELLAMIGGV